MSGGGQDAVAVLVPQPDGIAGRLEAVNPLPHVAPQAHDAAVCGLRDIGRVDVGCARGADAALAGLGLAVHGGVLDQVQPLDGRPLVEAVQHEACDAGDVAGIRIGDELSQRLADDGQHARLGCELAAVHAGLVLADPKLIDVGAGVAEGRVNAVAGQRLVGNPEALLARVRARGDDGALDVELGHLDHRLAVNADVLHAAPHRVSVEVGCAGVGYGVACVIDVRPGAAIAAGGDERDACHKGEGLLGGDLHFG